MFTLKGDVITLNLNDDNTKYLNELGREKLVDFLVATKQQMTFAEYVENYIKNFDVFPSNWEDFRELVYEEFVEDYYMFLDENFKFAPKHEKIIDDFFSDNFDDYYYEPTDEERIRKEVDDEYDLYYDGIID